MATDREEWGTVPGTIYSTPEGPALALRESDGRTMLAVPLMRGVGLRAVEPHELGDRYPHLSVGEPSDCPVAAAADRDALAATLAEVERHAYDLATTAGLDNAAAVQLGEELRGKLRRRYSEHRGRRVQC